MARPLPPDLARALDQQEFLAACDIAREALRQPAIAFADAAAIRIGLARALVRLGHGPEARSELEKCLAGPPGSLPPDLRADAMLEMADSLRLGAAGAGTRAERQARAGEALRVYRDALAVDPDRMDAMVRAAGVALSLGGPGDAAARELAERILALTAAGAA